MNLAKDLGQCTMLVASTDNCEFIVRRENQWQFTIETECRGRVNVYEKLQLDAVLDFLPDEDDIVEYIVHRRKELTDEQRRFVNSLRPTMCIPQLKGFAFGCAGERIDATHNPDGTWHLNGRRSSYLEVIHTVEAMLLNGITWQFEKRF